MIIVVVADMIVVAGISPAMIVRVITVIIDSDGEH